MKLKTILFFLALLIVLTVASGLLSGFGFQNLHPRFALISTPFMIILLMSAIKQSKSNSSKNSSKELIYKGFFSILLLVSSGLSGLANQMGFLPHFFHQLAVWPLVILLILLFVEFIELFSQSN